MAGVPQVAVLSPMLYNVYLSDLPVSKVARVYDISYAEDVSQIICLRTRLPRTTQARVMSEVNRASELERNWKIRTNWKMFQIVQIGKHKIFPSTYPTE